MLSAIWSKTPAFAKWLLLLIIVGALAFVGGRYSKPAEVITKTETVTVTKEVEVVKWQTKTEFRDRVVTKYVNQATLKQDRDTDCTEKFSETTGKMVERHCITKTTTDSTHTNSGSSASTNSGSTTSGGESNHTIDTSTHTTTTTTTINSLEPNWRLALSAFVKPELKLDLKQTQVGVGIERRLFWGFYLGVAAIPQSKLYGVTISKGF